MSAELQIATWENAKRLYQDAAFAYLKRSFATATFLAIASNEEAAKSVVMFCREQLDEKTFRRRFQHPVKHRISSAIWFVAGKISAAHMIDRAFEAGLFDRSGEMGETVRAHISTISGWQNPKVIADAIAGYIGDPNFGALDSSPEFQPLDVEGLRRQALYVDDDGQKIISDPRTILPQAARSRLNSAKVAIAVSSHLRSNPLDYEHYLTMLPRVLRNDDLRRSADMIRDVQASTERELAVSDDLTAAPTV